MRNKGKGKAQAQRKHAKTRALQRYHFELTRELQEQWVKSIQAGEAEHVFKQSNRVSIFAIIHEGQRLPVVYDRQRKTIVSVLPTEFWLLPGEQVDLQ